VTTLSPPGAEEAEAAGHTVIRGDATRQRTLLEAGIDRATVLVIADDDPAVAERTAQIARQLNPAASIIVRTRYNVEADPLAAAGADHVVSEEHASAAALTEKVLRAYRISDEQIREQVQRLWLYRQRAVNRGLTRLDEEAADRARRLSSAGTVVDTEQVRTLRTDASGCAHLGRVHPVLASAPGCEECLELDDPWVHLRICMFCGQVGCCDSSPGRHASKHADRAGHPIVISAEPGETWGWCYPDELRL
jgi:CPA2 family monovalent cation:H+ antiporter-2